MQRNLRRESFRAAPHTVSWFFAAASIIAGCAASGNHHAATPVASPAAPVINLDITPKRAEVPVASDEPPTPDVPAAIHATGPLVGQHAPHIMAEFVSGTGPASIAEARGKVVLIDFWATFCAPCSKSFPKYQALVDQFAGDFVVLAVSVDDTDTDKASLEEFVQMTGVKFSVLWDKDQEAARVYRLPKMPTSFIVDRSGIIRHVHAGFLDGTIEEMTRQIKALLAK